MFTVSTGNASRGACLAAALVLAAATTAPSAEAGADLWTPLGPQGASVNAVTFVPGVPGKLVAGTDTSFLVSTDGGHTWTETATGTEVEALAPDPLDPQRGYAATMAALVRTDDGAKSWVVCVAGTTSALAVDPVSPAVVYAGLRGAFVKSTDRGLTWASSASGLNTAWVLDVAVHPVQHAIVYAAVWGGVYRSSNAGATWTSTALTGRIPAVAVHPVDPSVVLAASQGVGLSRSTDGGATWTQVVSQGVVARIVADAAAPGTFYAATTQGVLASSDGGATWSAVVGGLTTLDVRALALDPADHRHLVAGTAGGGLFEITFGGTGAPKVTVTSPNGGESWIAGTVHPITWTSNGPISRVKIEVSTGGSWGEVFTTVAADVPNSGSYAWTVPQVLSPNCYVRISDLGGTASDLSDAAFTVTRCTSVNIAPFSAVYGASGGSGTVTVAAMPGCPWTATSGASWVTVTSGGAGTGSGTVGYTVAPNQTTSPRNATLTIGGQGFLVIQDPGTSTDTVLFVPIVLDVTGVGSSHFTSELTLTNRGGTDATVELAYAGAEDLGGASGTATVALAARRQTVIPDAIAALRAMGVPIPASGGRGGTLRARFSGIAAPGDAGATVRTTTPVPNGRAGLAYAGVPLERTFDGRAVICGLRESAADRSNLALQHAGTADDGPITLSVTVHDGATGAPVRLDDVVLAPGGFTQLGGVLATASVSQGWARVERVAGSGPFYAYGVVNDNANSDGSFVPPVGDGGYPEGITLPVVVEASVYTTELALTNLGEEARSIRLTLVAEKVTTPDGATSIDVAVPARGQLLLPGIVDEMRRRGAPGIGPAGTGFVGALFVTVPGGVADSLFVGARTSAPGGGGRYGLFYTGVPYGSASWSSATLSALQQGPTDRTNLAIVSTGEAGGGEDVFAVDVYDGATGQLVHTESEVALGARRFLQWNAPLAEWAPGVAQAWARVRRTSGSSPFIAYAVINDGGAPQQRSDDGAFVASGE